MAFPTPQGALSGTFKSGPLDYSLSVPQLLDLQLSQSPNHPVFVYENEDGTATTIKLGQYIRTVHRAASHVLDLVEPLEKGQSPFVIGILALIDSISYCTMVNAITRMGAIPFVISHRNSAAGLAHLLNTTNTACIFVSSDQGLKILLRQALDILQEHGSKILELEMPTFEQFQTNLDEQEMLAQMKTPVMSDIAVILHSSGSTSEFAKPIPLSHKTYLQWGILPWYGERDLCGEVMACQTVPIFHGMGVCLTCWPACLGLTIAFFRPSNPPIAPNPATVMQSVMATKCTLLFCVPAFLEVWCQNEQGLNMLKEMKVVVFGGASLNTAVGDLLIRENVNLTQFYGAIETGCLTPFLHLRSKGKDWQFFHFSAHCKPVLTPCTDYGHDNVYELALVDVLSHTPCFINTEVDGRPAYLLNDLLEKHPTEDGWFRVFGRTDDQMTLSNALNVNPVPLESTIAKHPLVEFAVMFGRGHTHPGVILQLKSRRDVGLMSPIEQQELLKEIWPAVEAANASTQAHSRIHERMILFASPSKPFEVTGKMQPRRPAILSAYKSEIEATYLETKAVSDERLIV
ncbi:hypothetical protein C8J56DRAFT_914327 [Mycena floridula]|nr:hypothetical protein C8J56DRAFT_914327 [Mycena floridula]